MEPLTVFDGRPSHPILGLADLKSSDMSFLDMAFEEGYRVLDTAAVYGLGASEKALGRWMRMRRNREKLVIITKGGHPSLWRPWRHRITVESIERDLSTSLSRLGCDYIDLYMLHRDASECDVPAVLQYLHEQTRQGRVRRLGASNWHHERIREANAVARRLGLRELSVSSPQLGLLSWSRPPWRGCVSASGVQGAAARAWYRDAAMPVLAWSPLGGGLTQADDGHWTPSGACYGHDENRARLARASALARDKGVTVPQILIAYLSALPCRVHPVCASRKKDHLCANRAALDLPLSHEEVRLLEGDVTATAEAIHAQ